jgi:hypothetical protein
MKKSKGEQWKSHGVDQEDNREWFRSFDKKADRYQYGPDYVGKFNQVTENGADDA